MFPARATIDPMTDRPATYEDLAATPEGVRAELIDGELILQASPAVLHQRVSVRLSADLLGRFERPPSDDPDRPGGWVFIAAPEVWLGSPTPNTRVLVPDLAGWKAERFPSKQATHGLTVRPDWVCEILSPSTRRYDRLRKADVYALAGVDWLWIADPDDGTVEVYAQRDGLWTRVAFAEAGEHAALPPFGVTFDVGAWWPASPTTAEHGVGTAP